MGVLDAIMCMGKEVLIGNSYVVSRRRVSALDKRVSSSYVSKGVSIIMSPA